MGAGYERRRLAEWVRAELVRATGRAGRTASTSIGWTPRREPAAGCSASSAISQPSWRMAVQHARLTHCRG